MFFITTDNYNIINTYATISAAIGTILAVILSLYFAYSNKKVWRIRLINEYP